MSKHLNLLLFQLNLMKRFEEIISCTPRERKIKVKDCTVIFLNCICNHCKFIGFN